MAMQPFVKLLAPRTVGRPDLPTSLIDFYTHHEGIGLESELSPDHVLRFSQLDEVKGAGWSDLHLLAHVPEGWEGFRSLRVGMGPCFEELAYVLHAPVCTPGSIVAIGGSLLSLGGQGPYVLEGTLVLAASFMDWLVHLERWGWAEPAIASAWNLTEEEWQEIYRYYLSLNPAMEPFV